MGDLFVAGLIAAGGVGEGTKGCAKVLLIEGAAKLWHVHEREWQAQFVIHNLHSCACILLSRFADILSNASDYKSAISFVGFTSTHGQVKYNAINALHRCR